MRGIGQRIDDRVRVVVVKRIANYRPGEYVTVSARLADAWVGAGVARIVNFRGDAVLK